MRAAETQIHPEMRGQSGSRRTDAIISWFGRLHVGSFGGLGIKVFWLILGLVPALLLVTGTIMWWNRVVLPRMREALKNDEIGISVLER